MFLQKFVAYVCSRLTHFEVELVYTYLPTYQFIHACSNNLIRIGTRDQCAWWMEVKTEYAWSILLYSIHPSMSRHGVKFSINCCCCCCCWSYRCCFCWSYCCCWCYRCIEVINAVVEVADGVVEVTVVVAAVAVVEVDVVEGNLVAVVEDNLVAVVVVEVAAAIAERW